MHQPAPIRLRFFSALRRALALRCPVCGQGKVFRGWMTMNDHCSGCGLVFEPEPGYFLGSIYFNYAATVLIATAVYLTPMILTGSSPVWLLVTVTVFCVVFPIFFFRYARCLWLALDHTLNPRGPSEPN